MEDEFKEKLLEMDIRDVYQRYFLGHDVWLFRKHLKTTNHAQEYDNLKLFMSKGLELHVNNIANLSM
ncbi:hypothetical protein EGC86_14710 [Shewanella frigidimarina]|uniref:hypothetical protein n=1 Tax=Shewanella frigidimarina TaxID=56812 RepID=UPI000F4D59AC|nr:hypothetical protein [Shewanella frigidimarina]RPA60321.1 hypothetical protein EGC86_14710 [Shewanella frigidimarina]